MAEQETVQLINDAIKIGFPVLGTVFGAILGALSTYFLTKLNHKKQVEKEQREWRLNLLMQIASDVTEFEHEAGLYIASVSNELRGVKGPTERHEEFRKSLSNQSKLLRKARANLKLLGLSRENRILEEYVSLVREAHSKGVNLKVERASELAELISPGPVVFYEALSEHISSNN